MADDISDIPENEALPPPSQSEKVFSGDLDAFKDALESLYISGNLSGRNHFRAAWPAAGNFIFNEALNEYDADGTGPAEDRDQRAAIEQEAEEKQNALLGQIIDIQESSVKSGMLNIEYVEKTIQALQRELALLIFAESLVDRFVPEEEKPGSQSGFNLGEKKNIFQVDFVQQDPISYHDLVKHAAENQGEESAAEPSKSLRPVFNLAAAPDANGTGI